MVIFIVIVFLLIVSFLWALHSLRKDLKRISKEESSKEKKMDRDREVVLFDRTRLG